MTDNINMLQAISPEKYHTLLNNLLDSISAQVLILDSDGTVQFANEKWKIFCERFNNTPFVAVEGDNYFENCKQTILEGNDYALKILLGLHSVLNKDQEQFTITYPVKADGNQCWFEMKAFPLDEQLSGLALVLEDKTSKMQKNRKLRETEEQYQRQFNNSLDGSLITSTKGKCIDANPEACRILGWSKEKLLQMTREELVVTSDPGYQDALEQRSKTGSYRAEYRMIKSDGTIIYVEAFSKMYRSDEGETRAIVNFRDITSRKKVEKQLIEEKKFTDAAVNSIPGIFFVSDEQGRIVRLNENAFHLFGYSGENLPEIDGFELIHPDDRQRAKKSLLHVLESGGTEIELRICTKDDQVRHLLFQAKKLEMDGAVYIVGTGIDVTAQKEIEEEKRRHQAMMDQLFENSPLGIAMINKDRNVIRINRSFSEIFGYSNTESMGQNIDQLLGNDTGVQKTEQLSSHGFNGDSFQVDTVRRAKDGTMVPVLIGGVPVEVNNELIATYGMYADISKRKELEEQVRELLKNEKEVRQNVEKAKLRLEYMFASAPSSICLLEGPDHEYTFANEAYKALINKHHFIGKTFREVHPDIDNQGFVNKLDEVYKSGEPYSAKETSVLLDRKGNEKLDEVVLNFVCKPLKNSHNEVYGIFIEAIDVTEQVNNRKRLSQSLEEKEVLIREIHHRVKNNLALISSMIELQLGETPDQYQTESLLATKSRVHTIAKIQELIYQHSDLNNIPFHQYLEDTPKLSTTLSGPEMGSYKVNLKLEPVHLNVNQAIPFGLLLNEIIAKTGEYLQNRNVHTLDITLQSDSKTIRVELAYNNSILKTPLNINEGKTLNDTLIQTLVQQLNANLRVSDSDNHPVVNISFERSDRSGAASTLTHSETTVENNTIKRISSI